MQENVLDELFHCHVRILRCGSDYGISKQSFRSTMHLFLTRNTMPFFFSIGSGDDYIQIKGLARQHVQCALTDDALLINTNEKLQIIIDGEHELQAGEKKQFPLHKTATMWKIVFASGAIVQGKISVNCETLSTEARAHLEEQYGALEKIQHGKSSFIFNATNNIVKVLQPSYLGNQGVIRRFLNAAQKFQRLPSDLFLQIDEIVYRRAYDLCYVVVERFAGETLENYLARKGIIAFDEAKNIIYQLACNLVALKERGYTCRNLSPDNILIDANNEVRITGFFLLKSEESMTVEGAQMVIPKYSAPEQIRSAADVDIAADVYSLGAIFHALLLGEPPFELSKVHEYMQFIEAGTPITPQQIADKAGHLSQETCELIALMLSPDKKLRPGLDQLLVSCSDGNQVDAGLLAALATEETGEVEVGNTPQATAEEFSQTFVALLNRVDEEVKLVDHDSDQEFSDDDIAQLSELRILSMAHPSITDANKRLRQVYKNADKKSNARKHALSSRKKQSPRAMLAMAIFTIIGVPILIATIAKLFADMLLPVAPPLPIRTLGKLSNSPTTTASKHTPLTLPTFPVVEHSPFYLGLEQWGKSWIAPSLKQSLREAGARPDKPLKVSWQLAYSQIRYQRKNNRAQLQICCKIISRPLLKNISVAAKLKMVHVLGDKQVVAQKQAAFRQGRLTTVTMALPSPLPISLYVLRLDISDVQGSFSQPCIAYSERPTWHRFFTVGKKDVVERYHRAERAHLRTLATKLFHQCQNWQRSPNRKHQQRVHRQIKKIIATIDKRRKRATMPLFPEIDERLHFLGQMLLTMDSKDKKLPLKLAKFRVMYYDIQHQLQKPFLHMLTKTSPAYAGTY